MLARASLLAGLDALRRAQISDPEKGRFYEASFQLGVGIERLLKLALVYDFMRKNDLVLPSKTILKDVYGHDLVRLYQSCKEIEDTEPHETKKFFSDDDYEYKILSLISQFSKSLRYFNIDELTDPLQKIDPISQWKHILWLEIQNSISQRKREAIHENTIAECERLYRGPSSMVQGFDGQPILAFEHHYFIRCVALVTPFLVWRVISILSPIYKISSELTQKVHEVETKMGIENPSVSFLDEFFPFLDLDRKTVIRRRRWSN